MERLEVAERGARRRAGGAGDGEGRPSSGPSSSGTTRWPTSPTRRRGTRRRGQPWPGRSRRRCWRSTTGSASRPGRPAPRMLKARQCQGCRIELYGNELAAVRNADPHEVVRCENCGRILVRTAESGPVSRRFIVEADGGSRGNPGPAGYGALVRDADTGKVLAERGGLGRAGDQQRRRVRRPGRRPAGRAGPRRPAAGRGADGLQARRRADVGPLEDQAPRHAAARPAGAEDRPAAGRRALHVGAARAERCRGRPGQQRDGRQADPPRPRRRAEHGRGRRPAGRRAGARGHDGHPPAAARADRAHPRAPVQRPQRAAAVAHRAGRGRGRARSGPRSWESTSSSPRRCGARGRPPRSWRPRWA